MGDHNHRYRPAINTPSFFPQYPNHRHHSQFYDSSTVFPQVPDHHHHHHQNPQFYNFPTVFANKPNSHNHPPPLFRAPSSSYTQNPNHYRVYESPTMLAPPHQPLSQPPPVVNSATFVPPRATTSVVGHNHQPQVYRAPSSYTQNPNHHHVFETPNLFAQSHQSLSQPPPVVISATSVPPRATTSVVDHSHPPQVHRAPSSYTQNPNHNQVYETPIVLAPPHQPLSQPLPEVINPTSVPPRATTSIVDYNLPYNTHNLYDVTYHTHTIHTLLTSEPTLVDSWISYTFVDNSNNRHNRHPYSNNLIVGLDIEWRPNFSKYSDNPIAIIQLCIGNRCLVFQILHSPYIPQSLVQFLGSAWNTFVGVGIEEDTKKLLRDYNLRVVSFVDLRGLAVDVLKDKQMKGAGLKRLSARVLELEMEKPKKISRSNWDKLTLSAAQVNYACIDAFVSFEVGRRLFGGSG